VGLQPFRFGEKDRRRRECGEACLIAAEQRGTFNKIKHAKTRGKARAARSRQNMAGAGDIVPDGLGRVTAEEDGAGVANPVSQRISLVEREFEVLGSDSVD
jgi:hypothetical protein